MRSRHVAATVAVLSVGLTAAAALHRRTATRLPATPVAGAAPAVGTSAAPAVAVAVAVAPDVPAAERDGVVLPFVRPAAAAPAPAPRTAPARCGDSGGLTKAGAPCAARATAGGRCHHHRQVA